MVVNLKDHSLIQGLDPYTELMVGLIMICVALVILGFTIKSCVKLHILETQRLRRLKYEEESERTER